MKNISLFQGILMAVFGVGALVGLFVFATYSSEGGPSAAVGSVTVWGTLPRDSMEATLRAVAQAEPALEEVRYIEKDAATLPGELATAIATGASPDLVLASHEDLLTLQKFIAPISYEFLPARTYDSSFVQAAQIFVAPGEGYWGIPYLVDPLVLYVNQAILASSGIAKPPATWEALTGLVPNVAKLTSSRQVTRGLIALGTYDNVRNARSILSTLFMQTGVPMVVGTPNGLRPNLGSSANSGVPAGQAVVRFYSQFADPAKVSYTWNASLPDSRQEFLAGDLALYLGHASERMFFREANPNLVFEVAPVPQPATATSLATYGHVYAFMIPTAAPNPGGAFQAAAFLSNPEEQALSALMMSLAPASRGVLSSAPNDAATSVAYESALYTQAWLSPAPAEVDEVFSSMIRNVTSGRTTLETALSLAERGLGSLLPE